MPYLGDILQIPSYGWKNKDGELIKPNTSQIFREFFSRLNIFKSRKNWLPFFSWLKVACLAVFFGLFLIDYLSW
ncbi:hypothetical protein [Mucilaginibacter agri]|uniref:hypothetical protein n=1 Tax=Mucilaginibacter agri TaxID=2695265 RepID=UPI001FB6D6BA|nr:hypothetical protein [Mucilaginibacter agri]